MANTHTLAEYFGAWLRNHEQSDADLATVLGVPIDQLPRLAAETVEVTEVSPGSEAESKRPIPLPLLPSALLPVAERHRVNFERLVDVGNGRVEPA